MSGRRSLNKQDKGKCKLDLHKVDPASEPARAGKCMLGRDCQDKSFGLTSDDGGASGQRIVLKKNLPCVSTADLSVTEASLEWLNFVMAPTAFQSPNDTSPLPFNCRSTFCLL